MGFTGTVARAVESTPDKNAALTNLVYISASDEMAACSFVEMGGFIFSCAVHQLTSPGCIALGNLQRKILRVAVRDPVEVTPLRARPQLPDAAMIYADVANFADKPKAAELNADDLIQRLIRVFSGQVFSLQQQAAFEHEGNNYRIQISSISIDVDGVSQDARMAYLRDNTAFIFTNTQANPVKITGQKGYATTQLFKSKQINFEQLGIGGLDKQFEAIFRRAFASRVFPPSIVNKLGIKHVKGMLLYGPPGTGKTLIARQIGKMLNGKEPKVVNGPEVLNKYVGQTEENIRNLFAEADAEYRDKGDDSELHIIIFDEIDAICKSRGSVRDGSGVHDTVVNQLLTKIDGVDALNNILLIGMTNRKDMLDEALLRPGRLEVQIEVGLPDEKGRLQILKIHTNKMASNSFLDREVDLEKLAESTKNFSGAEIEGLVKDAVAYALNRNVDFDDLHKPLDEDNIKVTAADFMKALEEVKPAFGAATESLEAYRIHGMLDCGTAFGHLLDTLRTLVRQVATSEKTPLLTCLLEGPAGSGKSALAATVGLESGFPFVKVVSPETMVGFSETAKSSAITKVFEDAYKSPFSIVILDDIERLLDYVAIGPRFSNAVLQVLLVLIKKQPPRGRKLLVVGTTSAGDVSESMGLSAVFNVSLVVPPLRADEVARVMQQLDVFEPAEVGAAVQALTAATSAVVPIKKLLLWLEMAKQDVEPGMKIPVETWRTVLADLSC
uniref:Vesicle-fusing ATPase n=1 Tax=Chlamydomonas euryale TaxID=1486919 RepID=A0A7R9YT48_9CHLO|mmetsp:Transcript_20864/g.62362  ORF Transcript_20864/g.62362 Transcript_20864/m.62362 type:complete len:727 (+) Transcript_20864:654-2834(+)